MREKDFLKENHDAGFAGLFREFYRPLVSYAYKHTSDLDASENIVQDLFVRIWETWDKISGFENISAYLYQMTYYRCLSQTRNEKNRSAGLEKFREFQESSLVTESEEFIKADTFRYILRAIDELPGSCRDIFNLTIQGYSAKEIAGQMNIAVETVKKQKQIARRKLKEKLGDLFAVLYVILGPF